MADRNRPIAVAVITGVFALAAAVVGGIFSLAGREGPVASGSPSASSYSVSAASSPVGAGQAGSQASATGPVVPGVTPPPSAVTPASAGPAVSGVPRRVAAGDSVVLRGSGFQPGRRVRMVYTIAPGEDIAMNVPPVPIDAEGRFTVTFSVDSMFCGYQGALSTVDFEEDRQLTNSPMSVVC